MQHEHDWQEMIEEVPAPLSSTGMKGNDPYAIERYLLEPRRAYTQRRVIRCTTCGDRKPERSP